MILISIIMLLLVTAGLVFSVALLIEKYLIKPPAGTTRIFSALLMAAPLTGVFWGLAFLLVEANVWAIAIATAVIGYVGALVPAFIRLRVIRRHSAKLNANAATTFE